MRYIKLALSFIFICVMGLFTSWIGGIEPFTEAAGWSALFTFLVAFMLVGILVDSGGL